MSEWPEVSRIHLTNGDEALDVIIQTNGKSWKLFARHSAPGQEPRCSEPWWFMSPDRAAIEQREKADEARADGWVEYGPS